jgi:HlyD family secretion protein
VNAVSSSPRSPNLRTEVGKDLADIRAKTAEYVERKINAEDQLRRVDIRAPQDGVVHQLSVHTVGGVIAQGEQIMLIVPQSDELDVEAKIQPQDIDQLRLGQTAVLRFSAFNQRTTPRVQNSRLGARQHDHQSRTGSRLKKRYRWTQANSCARVAITARTSPYSTDEAECQSAHGAIYGLDAAVNFQPNSPTAITASVRLDTSNALRIALT